MANHRMGAEFEMICSNYFSRWRGATAWRFKEGPRAKWKDAAGVQHYTSECGYCDAETRDKMSSAFRQDLIGTTQLSEFLNRMIFEKRLQLPAHEEGTYYVLNRKGLTKGSKGA